jgi:hypothetical protein
LSKEPGYHTARRPTLDVSKCQHHHKPAAVPDRPTYRPAGA